MATHKRDARDDPRASPPAAAGSASEIPDQTSAGAPASDPASDSFRTFMVALATDPARLGAFIKDPDAAMTAAGLDPVDQVVLKSGDPGTIHARLSGQRFAFASPSTPTPVTVLVVDMTRQPGTAGSAASDQPAVRSAPGARGLPNQGSSPMFPQIPQQLVYPQQIFPQQIFPQQIFPQQIFPQIHPQQIFPQVHPQIFPQIHPQQVFPQIHPQQVFPQIHPQQVFPPIWPQLVIPPQIVLHPQYVIFPQLVLYPQIHPQLVAPGPQG